MEGEKDHDSSSFSSAVGMEGPIVLPCSLPTGGTKSLLVALSPSDNPQEALSDRASSARTVATEKTTEQSEFEDINHKDMEEPYHDEADIMREIRNIVGRTTILNRQPRTNDIIGISKHCLAAKVPKLPQEYVSSTDAPSKKDRSDTRTYSLSCATYHDVNHRAARLYATGFVPHVALEVRCEIVGDVNKLMDAASKEGYVRTAKNDKHGSANYGAHSPQGYQRQDKVPGGTEKTLSRFLLERFPLSKWVEEEAVPAVQSGSMESDPLYPGRLNFTINIVRKPSSPNTQRVCKDSTKQFDEDEKQYFFKDSIVLVFLPLTTVFDAWLRWRAQYGTGSVAGATEDESCIKDAGEVLNSIPEIWRIFGCLPQVCYVKFVGNGQREVILSCYSQQDTAGAMRQGLYGSTLPAGRERECESTTGASKSPPSVANLLPFVHALRLGFNRSTDVFYIKWLGSMNPTFAAVRALFGISSTHFAPILYDPRGTSLISQNYHNSMERYFSDSDVMNEMKGRLLLQRLLNDWQVKAVAAVLYAVHPSWCREQPPSANARGERQLVDAADDISQRRGRPDVPIPEIHIIEGPPGTGKTQILSTLILNFLHYLSRGSRILLCGPSNCAVDEALLRVLRFQKLLREDESSGLSLGTPTLAAQAELLRIGIRHNVSKEVLEHRPLLFLDDKIREMNGESLPEEKSFKASSRSRRTRYFFSKSDHEEIIRASSVIFTTLGSIHQLQRLNIRFDVVIVDEVSQTTEPSILPALLSTKGKCILVGDWKQLQPTVLHQESARCGLQCSLLERLLRNGYPSHILRIQYRMHPDICSFPNRYFYGDKLQTDSLVLQRQCEGWPPSIRKAGEHGDSLTMPQLPLQWDKKTIAQKLGSITRLAFVDVPDGVMQRGRGNSWHNKCESDAVVRFMRQIRNYLGYTIKDFAQHVGIITYYIAQRDAILQALTIEEKHSGIQIATVDSFQGKEKDIILISCVRADTNPNASVMGPKSKQSKNGTALGGEASEFESPANVGLGMPSGGIGFLSNWHRIDVSLTRAKELCIVFGHRTTLEAASPTNMKATEGSAAPCAVSVAEYGGAGVTVSNSLQRDATGNLAKKDEDPSVLSEFIQHVMRHDVSPGSKARRKYGSACKQATCKNGSICTSSGGSVKQKTGEEACNTKNGVPACQAAYITYHKKMLLIQHLQQ